MDIAIDAAREGMVASARRQLRVPIVVQLHGHDVVAGHNGAGSVKRESGVAALVCADRLSIDVDLGVLKCPVELQKDPFARPFRRRGEVLPIPAIADVDRQPRRIVVGARLRAGGVTSLEFPGLIEIESLAIARHAGPAGCRRTAGTRRSPGDNCSTRTSGPAASLGRRRSARGPAAGGTAASRVAAHQGAHAARPTAGQRAAPRCAPARGSGRTTSRAARSRCASRRAGAGCACRSACSARCRASAGICCAPRPNRAALVSPATCASQPTGHSPIARIPCRGIGPRIGHARTAAGCPQQEQGQVDCDDFRRQRPPTLVRGLDS